MKLLLQKNVFECSEETLKFLEDSVEVRSLNEYNKNERYFFRGSIEKAIQLKEKNNVEVWFDKENYDFTSFASGFSEYLLNEDHKVYSLNEFKNSKEKIQNRFGTKDFITDGNDIIIFARPDSGLKSFSGQVIGDTFWKAFIDLFKREDVKNIVVSSPKKIEKEFRFIVFNNEILTGSSYILGNEVKYKSIKEGEDSFLFAEKAAKTSNFETKNKVNCYILDVCKTNGTYKVVEINAFSTSGLYSSNRKIIFENLKSVWGNY